MTRKHRRELERHAKKEINRLLALQKCACGRLFQPRNEKQKVCDSCVASNILTILEAK